MGVREASPSGPTAEQLLGTRATSCSPFLFLRWKYRLVLLKSKFPEVITELPFIRTHQLILQDQSTGAFWHSQALGFVETG